MESGFMSDFKDFKHGEEGTHYACKEMMDKYQGNPGCCGCQRHDCKETSPSQSAEEWQKTLCLDGWFPNCNGTRTHPMTVFQILNIPEIRSELARQRKETAQQAAKEITEHLKKKGLEIEVLLEDL